GDHAVDLVRPFKNAVDARIAIGALRRVLLDEAVTAVDLHDLVDHLIDHLRAPDLQDGALDGVVLDAFAHLRRRVGSVLIDLAQRDVDHTDGTVRHRNRDLCRRSDVVPYHRYDRRRAERDR